MQPSHSLILEHFYCCQKKPHTDKQSLPIPLSYFHPPSPTLRTTKLCFVFIDVPGLIFAHPISTLLVGSNHTYCFSLPTYSGYSEICISNSDFTLDLQLPTVSCFPLIFTWRYHRYLRLNTELVSSKSYLPLFWGVALPSPLPSAAAQARNLEEMADPFLSILSSFKSLESASLTTSIMVTLVQTL